MDPKQNLTDAQIVKEQQERKDRVENAIRQMEQYVRKAQDGTLLLDVSTAAEANVDPELFDTLKRSLDETNALIKSGRLKPDDVRVSLD